MIFKELLCSVSKQDILDYFSKIEGEVAYLDKYSDLYDKLIEREVIKHSDFKLFLVYQKSYFDFENEAESIEVYGYDEKENQHYALDFVEWSKWLGTEVVEKSVRIFTPLVFVAECLHEMTFISFDESRIAEEKNILDERVQEIEDGTATFVNFEDLIEHFNEEFGWDCKVVERTLEEDEKESQRIKKIKEYNDAKLTEMLEN